MERPYVYYDFTLSLCSQCLRRVDAKIVFENDQVWMLKRCPEHGAEKVLIADDVEYYRSTRNYAKRSEMPRQFRRVRHELNQSLMCCLPQVRAIKKSCVHIVSPDDKKIIPFETMNLFYRDPMKRAVLEQRQRELPGFAANKTPQTF